MKIISRRGKSLAWQDWFTLQISFPLAAWPPSLSLSVSWPQGLGAQACSGWTPVLVGASGWPGAGEGTSECSLLGFASVVGLRVGGAGSYPCRARWGLGRKEVHDWCHCSLLKPVCRRPPIAEGCWDIRHTSSCWNHQLDTGLGFYFFLKFLFNWRIIALQYCVGFCSTSAWVSDGYTYVPSILNLPPTSHPIPPLFQGPKQVVRWRHQWGRDIQHLQEPHDTTCCESNLFNAQNVEKGCQFSSWLHH